MKKRRSLGSDSSLTEWEWAALDKTYNLADGHAHMELGDECKDSLGDLTRLFLNADVPGQDEREVEFLSAFFGLVGQSLSLDPDPPLLHYSSSVSIEIVAKSLVARDARSVALIAPTFDNIPLLLRRHSLKLVAIPDNQWADGNIDRETVEDVDALFVVVPNNPTGTEPPEPALRELMQLCADAHTTLVCDFSFRLYSQLGKWDQYKAAREVPDLDWVFLEDTGKCWPARELKVGICSSSESLASLLERVTDEVLLNVSPFTLATLTRFIECDRRRLAGGLSPIANEIVELNRKELHAALGNSSLQLKPPSSRISVEWIELPAGWTATAFCNWLDDENKGLSVLPGSPFHWESSLGENFIRVALMRDPDVFRGAANRLAELAAEYEDERP